ncbi:unnamed protein product [Ectocarpus sp. CCAP 1310/34]|nr:unnamed protein product [Ectocarpus sp. CCAP 1310/34]
MSTASLMLEKNASSDWVINRMKGTNWGDKPNVGHASLFQFLPGFYVAMSVKESGKCYSEPERNAGAVKVYKSFAVPAFLRWLVEEYDFTNTPAWLTKDIMGSNSIGPKVLRPGANSHIRGRSPPTENELQHVAFPRLCFILTGAP